METINKDLKPIDGIKIGDDKFNIKNYSAGVEEIESGDPLAANTFYYMYEDDLDGDDN
jgi:hypothetical protein